MSVHTEYGVIHTRDIKSTYQELNGLGVTAILRTEQKYLDTPELWRDRRYQDQWVICSTDFDRLYTCDSIDAHIYVCFDQDKSQWSMNLTGRPPLHLIYAQRNWAQRPWDELYFRNMVEQSRYLDRDAQRRLEKVFQLPFPQLEAHLKVGHGVEFLALTGIPFVPYYDEVFVDYPMQIEGCCVLWKEWQELESANQISA